MIKDELTSETINLVRFPLAVMVVYIHSIIRPEETFCPVDYVHLTGTDVYNLIRSFFSHVFSHIAVPTFFLISGYLFYKRLETWDWIVWRKKMKSRLQTLVIPYFIWCIISVLLKPNVWESYIRIPIFKLGAVILKGKPLHGIVDYWNSIESQNINWFHELWDIHKWGGQNLNWLGDFAVHNTGPYLLHFWFLRDLMVVVALSPIICWLTNKFSLWFIALIGILYISGIWPDIHGLGATSLFFFSLGAWFTLKRRDLCMTLYPYRWSFYIFYLFLLPNMVYLDGTQTYGVWELYIIIGVMSIICFSYYLAKEKRVRMNQLLVSSCFFVYAFHRFIHEEIYWCVNNLVGSSSAFQQIITYLVFPLITITICVCTYYSLHRWLPSLCKVLTGGR